MNMACFSREKMIKHVIKNPDEKMVIISIAYFDGEPNPSFGKWSKNVRQMNFIFDDEEDDRGISISDAVDIAQFVKQMQNWADSIFVHCDAGVSRSAGVIAAIGKWIQNDDSFIFDDGKFCPNMRCFRFVLNQLMDEIDEDD